MAEIDNDNVLDAIENSANVDESQSYGSPNDSGVLEVIAETQGAIGISNWANEAPEAAAGQLLSDEASLAPVEFERYAAEVIANSAFQTDGFETAVNTSQASGPSLASVEFERDAVEVIASSAFQTDGFDTDVNSPKASRSSFASAEFERDTVDVITTPIPIPTVTIVDAVTTNEDTSVIISVLANDTDVDGTTATLASATNGTNGTTSVNTGAGVIIYRPNANFSGTDAFTYTNSEGAAGTVSVTVTAMNDAPIAVNDTLAATEDTAVTYSAADLLGSDTDVDGNTTLTIASVTDVTGGTAVLNGNGTVTFTPTLNFNGEASFSYIANDGTTNSNSATVTVNVVAAPTITHVGDPGGFGSAVTVDEGATGVFTVELSATSSVATSYALTFGGTATAVNDYTNVVPTQPALPAAQLSTMVFSNGVTFDGTNVSVPAGVKSFTIAVPTIDDSISEPTPETFIFTVGGQAGTGTINDNDGPPTIGHVGDSSGSTNNVTVLEGLSSVFTINLSHVGTTATSFALTLSDDTANLTSDYTNALIFSNGVTFDGTNISVPAGVASFTVTAPTTNDTSHELTEIFKLSVGGVEGTGTITDNDATPTVSSVSNTAGNSNNVTVDEGTSAVFKVSLSNASSIVSTFTLALHNGSANLTSDYTDSLVFSDSVTINSGNISVPTGVTSFTVTVPTVNDTVAEVTESFILSVDGMAATGNITANDSGTPPANTIPGSQDNAEDTTLTFNTTNSNLITVAEDVTTTTLSVGSGTLNAQTLGGATITTNTSGSVMIAGTMAQINVALDGLVYTGVADYNGSVILTMASTGAGSAVTTSNIAINMTPVVDITDDSVSFTPTSTGFCDSVPATDTALASGQIAASTAANTIDIGSTNTDTVIHGLGGNDTITTTSSGTSTNSIVTLGGNDTITTTTVNGKNIICAGDGNNIITTTVTGTGGNFVSMGSGNDTMTTTNVNGDNTIMAGDGNNNLTTTTTGTGNTKVVTGTDNDTITTTNAGGTSTVLSGGGNDTVTTGAGADTVVSGAGNDTVTTTGGADIVLSGSGNDTVTTGEGDDIVLSATGNDTIAAGAGDDKIFSGSGNDRINAAAGADIIDSGSGNDTIVLGGDSDVDTVIFGATAVANGSDVITNFVSGTDKLNLDAMTAQTATTAVAGSLTVTADSVYFFSTTTATAASTVGLSATALEGGATWINAANGTVAFFVVSAPNGSAIYRYVEAGGVGISVGELTLMGTIDATITTSDLVFEANAAAATALAAGMAGLAATEDAPSVSSLIIDVLANDSFENSIKTIAAVNGSAITDGGDAVAVANGSIVLLNAKLVFTPTVVTYNGLVSFTYTVTSGGVDEIATVNVQVGDVVVEEVLRTEGYTVYLAGGAGTAGDDIIWGVAGAQTIIGGAGNDIIIGGAGADTSLSGEAGNDIIWGRAGADFMHGGEGNDSMWGGAAADTMTGGAGDDFLDGGLSGDDSMDGGAGNDTLVYDAVDVTKVDGGADEDTLIFASATTVAFSSLSVPRNFEIIDLSKNGAHSLSAISLAEVVAITDGNNTLTILKDGGDTVALDNSWTKSTSYTSTVIDGVSRPMDLYTNIGNASVALKIVTIPVSTETTSASLEVSSTGTLTGGAGDDLLTGLTGIGVMDGNAGNDIMYGGTGVDTMDGGSGNDVLMGGTGKDIITGGFGSDVMHGGDGGDTFKWNVNETGNDFVNDFKQGPADTDDVLDLTDLLVGESSDAATLDDYLDFSDNGSGGTLISVDANGTMDGGKGQTITLEGITYANWGSYAASNSDSDIITQMLADTALIVSG